MKPDAKVVVVTPWYPTQAQPSAGIFVREWTAALAQPPQFVTIVHVLGVPPQEDASVVREPSELGEVVRIRVPMAATTTRFDSIGIHRAALESHAADILADADVVIAHVGVPTGIAVHDLLEAQTVLVTVEHASYLDTALRDPRVAAAYEQMVARSSRHLMVSAGGAVRVRFAMPGVADRVVAVGNPVDDRRFALANHRGELDRWLYVGSLTSRKGVADAVRALALYRKGRPGATLTIVGEGPEREKLRQLVAECGLEGAVTFAGPIAFEDTPAAYAAHDLLVHLALVEPFGLTMVEAAMTGLPVVARVSDGPAATLDVARANARAATVGAGSPHDVVAAVKALERALGESDATLVRADLVERYGLAGFGARLRAVCAGEPWWQERTAPHVWVVAATRAGCLTVPGVVAEAERLGLPCSVGTVDPPSAQGLPPEVPVTPLRGSVVTRAARAAWVTSHRTLPRAAARVLVAARAPGAARALRARTFPGGLPTPAREVGGSVRGAGMPALVRDLERALEGRGDREVLLVPCDERAASACAALARREPVRVATWPGGGAIARALME